MGSINRRIMSRLVRASMHNSIQKITEAKRAGDVAQMV
jgi:hypothetical protein